MATRKDLANAIRALSMDAVQKANSGHPGMPMGMADIAVALWTKHLKHNPANPKWADRDRFVLSNGHGSMLLYSLLHLTGYDLSIEDLKAFRQWGSKTPGHPEYGYAPGIETTTGPLGQGVANAVGMALAEKLLAAEFNQVDFSLVDHYTYVFLGDGCLMEGISHEACSLAGTLGLGKLIAFYDDNGISIDGHVEGWFTDNTVERFKAYGWQVIPNVDGHDIEAVDAAIVAAKADAGRPTLICCKTTIGQGSPNKAGTHDVHGAPLGEAEIAAVRVAIGWPYPAFEIPQEIYAKWDAKVTGQAAETHWNHLLANYRQQYPEAAAAFVRRMAGELPTTWTETAQRALEEVVAKAEEIATRKASQNAIQALVPHLPEIVGGSADLAGSNLTLWKGCIPVTREQGGNYLYYGVREFGMAAIMNGLALHGGLRPFGGTFLMFSEYARNALRMASLMKINPIFVFTHDSIGLGEDGPTHQPIEQTATLRMIPNMEVWRPADTVETMVAWQAAIALTDRPAALILSRQNLAFQTRDSVMINAIARGGYILKEVASPQAVLIATGSEVDLAVKAQAQLAHIGIAVRVVSMPSTNVFDRQDKSYREAVLGGDLPRLAIEAGVTGFWRQYVGLKGEVIGIDCFGESAPASELFNHFGLTVDNIVARTKALLKA
jgi:transketolase